MIVEAVCLVSGLVIGYLCGKLPAKKAPSAERQPRVHVAAVDTVPTFPSVLRTPGGPTYRVIAGDGTVLTETSDPASAAASWRVLRDSARAVTWHFMEDGLRRGTLEPTQ